MKTLIRPYSIILPDNSTKEGYEIIYLEDDGTEISIEEYYGSTAEQWLAMQGLTSLMVQALTRLEQKIILSGKPLGTKMSAVKDWLENIMDLWSESSEPRLNWQTIPYTPEETVAEAKQTLMN
jgi:hypothetical protein